MVHMKIGHHPLLLACSSPHPNSATTFFRNSQNTLKPHFASSSSSSSVRFIFSCRSSKWDSNADSISNFDDEDEGDASSYGRDRGNVGLLDEITDNIYIFKVFRSYGWTLLPIILSLLLSSGLAAFLFALALSLGLSTLSLAFNKVLNQMQKSTKRKTSSKRKPFPSSKKGVKTGYQTWVSENDASSFGGWDNMGSTRKKARTRSESRRIEIGKLNKRMRRSKTPFWLRLIIAVFPFLGSWTKLL